jgi:hypothetical protein
VRWTWSRDDIKGLAVALGAVTLLALTAATTLGGFSATVANTTNQFSSGTIQLKEGVGSTTCFSTGTGSGGSVTAADAGTCSGIDDLGAAMDQVPGGTPVSTTVTLTNVGTDGTTAATLAASACRTGAASDDGGYVGADGAGFCAKVDVTVANTTAGATDLCVYPTQAASCPAPSSADTLASLASQTLSTPALSALAAGGSATYVITVQLDAGATNADQGLTATIPLTWSITQ